MITQQDIYEFVTNQANYTSEEVLFMIMEYIKSPNYHQNCFLESLNNGFSLPINLLCYAKCDVAFSCLKKLSNFNVNWYESFEQDTYIDICVRDDNVQVLQFLVEQTQWKDDIENYYVNHNMPILFYAVEHNAIECLKYLIEKLNLNIHNSMHYEGNLLTWAASNGSIDCAQYLIKETKINYSYDFGTGHHAIFCAISGGNPVMVQYLVESNLYDLNVPNKHGITIFKHLLEEKEGNNSFNYLFPFFKNNLDVNFIMDNGEHYFFYLLQNNNHANLFSLIENLEIDLTQIISSHDGQDLLMRASFSGNVDFIEYLIQEQKLNPRNNTHKKGHFNVLINAVAGNNEALVNYYLEKGYHLNKHTFDECFKILNQKEAQLKEYNLTDHFLYQSNIIKEKLNHYYAIIEEKEFLDSNFSHTQSINKKKIKV